MKGHARDQGSNRGGGAPRPQKATDRRPDKAAAPRKPAHPHPVFRRPSAELAVLYGFHCVCEALRNKARRLLDLYATAPAAERLKQEIQSANVALHVVEAEDLARRLGPDAVHQGLLLEARPLAVPQLDEIMVRSGELRVPLKVDVGVGNNWDEAH